MYEEFREDIEKERFSNVINKHGLDIIPDNNDV